jgi:hypothetical protein
VLVGIGAGRGLLLLGGGNRGRGLRRDPVESRSPMLYYNFARSAGGCQP